VSFKFQSRHFWLALFFVLSAGLMLMSCTGNPNSASGSATKDEAEKFLADAEKKLLDLNIKAGRADWVKSTFITDDTESLAAEANDNLIAATTELAEQARRYENVDLSPESKRKLKLLKLSLTLPAPKDPKERTELPKIPASMEGEYGKGKKWPDGLN
jgi:peptidyl-dipeptidase A